MDRHERVHTVCRYLKTAHNGSIDYDTACEKCPEFESDERYGKVQRGCYCIAQEVCNYAKYGNAWGHPVMNWLWRRWYRLKNRFTLLGAAKQTGGQDGHT